MASDSIPGVTPFPAKDVSASSSLAGFQFNDGRSYRVFYQTSSGAISAIYSDDYGASWGGPRSMVPPGLAADGTPMASVIFTDASGGSNSRTFFLSPDRKLSVLSVASSQVSYKVLAGGLLEAAPFSKLGAVVNVNRTTPCIRVYYQTSDGRVQEAKSDGGEFVHSYTFPPPMAGSALAFINPAPPGPYIRGYYEHSNNVAMEICNDKNGPWFAGEWKLSRQIENGSRMSATLIPGQPNSFGQMTVYFTDRGQVVESTNDGVWRKAMVVPGLQAPSQGLLAVAYRLPNSDAHVRIFYIGPNGLIHWKRKQNGVWVDGNDPISGGKVPVAWSTSCDY